MSRARDNANLGTQAGSGLDASDITSGALGASVTGGAGLGVSTATTTALNDKAPFGLHKPWGENPKKGHGKYYEDIKRVCEQVKELERLNGL